jgi:glycosyltransferase involved in cell wall biosynthesis
MKILMTLSNPFTHDPRVNNEARSLINAGHDVTILAWDRKRNNPSEEVKDGIQVVRSYNTKFMDLLPYDIFRLHFWWKKGYKDALKLCEKKPFDVVHCHNLDTLPIGIKLKKKLGIRLVYDAHEIWGYMVSKDLPGWWANYYLKKEKNIINNADKIITVNDPLKDYLSKITNKPITIVMNCKPLQNTKYEPPNTKKFTLLYIGVLSKSRFLLEIVEVVQKLSEVHLIIGGIGKKGYVESLKNNCSESENIDFIGIVPTEKVIPMTKKADAIVCIFDPNNKNNQVGLPNKVFEAAICGRPMIITKDLYYEKIVVEKGKFGISIEYTKESLKNAILKLKKDKLLREELGKKALKAAINEYNWEKQEKKLIEVYKELKK